MWKKSRGLNTFPKALFETLLFSPERLCMPWLDYGGAACVDLQGGMSERNGCLEGACALAEEETALWNPLLLLIPLRLGLSDINEAYIETLKQCFQLPQSLGVIGGKPNSAHYFIGYVGMSCTLTLLHRLCWYVLYTNITS
ncbi:unnamed protein product [Oncorhynchus mykiss]|uniref:Cysteine protease n=1 Tax=Oncorhynchus mykiss TaxID=8022 RepID=A0A060ZFV5_ONCMY|nr:unnamed protein product [Oncorhynchus mykiss]